MRNKLEKLMFHALIYVNLFLLEELHTDFYAFNMPTESRVS